MNDAATRQIHTIIGAGQVGTQLARELAASGHHVRLVRRSEPGDEIAGVQWLQGDALDTAFMDTACEGATAVYNTSNPPDYHRWDGQIQPLFRAIWQAAARAGARLVQLDNLYMYGRPERMPFDESTPMQPCSPNGEIRRQLADELLEMSARGELRMTIARASDFFGPHAPQAAVFRGDVMAALRRGRTAFVMGNPDTPHSYTYIPDVARFLAVLGTHPAAEGKIWHLPSSAENLTTRDLMQRFADQLGQPAKVRRVPQWFQQLLGLVVPLFRAVASMNYQWDVPYVADSAQFRRVFGLDATPLDKAITATLRG